MKKIVTPFIVACTMSMCAQTTVKIFPVPFADHITVEVAAQEIGGNKTEIKIKTEIFNLTGNSLYAETITTEDKKFSITIDTSGFPRDMYMIQTTVNGKVLTTKKIRKE